MIALAASADGALVAAAGIRGSVAIIDRAARSLVQTLVGPGLPVWSVVFLPDNQTLVTGGNYRLVRRWERPPPASTSGRSQSAASGGSPGSLRRRPGR